MARRYGRNQRRQAQNTIAQLELAVKEARDSQREAIKKQAADSMRFRRYVANLVDELPDNSALLAELQVEVLQNWPPMSHRRAPARQRPSLMSLRDSIKQVALDRELAAMQIIELVTYRLEVGKDDHLLNGRIRFKVTNDKTEATAYCVDARHFLTRGFSERMIMEMAETIAKELADYHQKILHGRMG